MGNAGGSNSTALDLHGFTQQLAGLSTAPGYTASNATITNNGYSPTLVIFNDGNINNNNNSTATPYFTFGGNVLDGTSPLGVSVQSVGILTLTGSLSYSGGNYVSNTNNNNSGCTLILASANSGNGRTTIGLGTIELTNANALQNSPILTIPNNGSAVLALRSDTSTTFNTGGLTVGNVNSSLTIDVNQAANGIYQTLTLGGNITQGLNTSIIANSDVNSLANDGQVLKGVYTAGLGPLPWRTRRTARRSASPATP